MMTGDDVHSPTSLATEGAAAIEDAQVVQNVQTSTRVSVSHNVRLPPFSQQHTSSWFLRAEAHFRTQKITDKYLKADLVMTVIPEEVFNKIAPWITSKPGAIAYDDLKAKLTETYTLPVPVRAQRVLDLIATPLGDAKPSEAWDEIIGLMTLDEVDERGDRKMIDLSREIFLRRLPKNIRAQIPDAEILPKNVLVEMAEKLHEAAKASRFAASTTINLVEDQDAVEETEINAIHGRKPWQNQSRPPRQPQPQPQPQPHPHSYQQGRRQQQPQRPTHSRWRPKDQEEARPWCFYHQAFGSKARNCQAPCTFPKN